MHEKGLQIQRRTQSPFSIEPHLARRARTESQIFNIAPPSKRIPVCGETRPSQLGKAMSLGVVDDSFV
jgi:hypothetical protein